MSCFGKNIKKIRSVKGLSQQSFAEIFDLKRATLGAYEEGRSEPKIETIIKVANHFSISVDELLTHELTINQLLRFRDDMEAVIEKSAKEIFESIPCLTARCVQEFISFHQSDRKDEVAFVNDLPQVVLPLADIDGLIAYMVQSLEMSSHDQGLFPGDMVVCKECDKISPKMVKQELLLNALVLVLTEDQLMLRRLALSENELILSADHINVSPVKVKIGEVQKIWKVVHHYALRPPIINSDISHRLMALEKRVSDA